MYLFDSSAIIEILKGNPATVEKYRSHLLVTINLAYGEVYYFCLKVAISQELKKITFELIDYSVQDIEQAMELLFQRKKQIKDFSFVDALVYTAAKNNGLILVTKDFGFKGLEGVEMIEGH